MNVVEGSLRSVLTQRAVPYRVVLPVGYQPEECRYPSLYLLHGLFGASDNWLQFTKLIEYVKDKELIVVLPDCGDSWYTDSATEENDKFESFFFSEMIPEIDALYRTIPLRKKRAVAGISMGGYGALKFGCRRPDLFDFVGCLSGAFDAPSISEDRPGRYWAELAPSIRRAFGEKNSVARTENDIYRMIAAMPAESVVRLPYFYIACGNDDQFIEANRRLVELLISKFASFESRMTDGGHDWYYWDKELSYLLKVMERRLRRT